MMNIKKVFVTILTTAMVLSTMMPAYARVNDLEDNGFVSGSIDESYQEYVTRKLPGGYYYTKSGLTLHPGEFAFGDMFENYTVEKLKISWTSSRSSVATVSSTGYIKAKVPGETVIKGSAKINGKNTVVVEIQCTVLASALKSFSVKNVSVNSGKNTYFNVTTNPSLVDLYSDAMTVKSSNSKVATARFVKDESAGSTPKYRIRVYGKIPGKAVITCTYRNDNGTKVTRKFNVTVNKVKVTGVKLNRSTVTIKKGKTFKLTAAVSPSNATNKAVTWKTSNKNVAVVDSSGKITARKAGKAVITCVTKDGGYSAKCTVTVK